jgi:Zn-dependent peptidase ImmA (M78 family)
MRTLVNRLVPAGATMDEVLSAVCQMTGRPIEVADLDLKGDASGTWVPTPEAHRIFVDVINPERRPHVIGHEIGHILLGHQPSMRSHYDEPQERDAELFSTLLMQRMRLPRLGSASTALR